MRRGLSALLVAAILSILGLLIFMQFRNGDQGQSHPFVTKEISATMPFYLMDQTGRQVTDKDYLGKWVLIFFGYTHCPDICPTALADVGAALTALGPVASNVQPLFVTVDPVRDTSKVLASYLANFDPRIIGLTGTNEQVTAAAKVFGVYFSKQAAASGNDYGVNHSAAYYLINPSGHYVRLYSYDIGSEGLARELRKQISGYGAEIRPS